MPPKRTPEQRRYDMQTPKGKVATIKEVINALNGENKYVIIAEVDDNVHKLAKKLVGVDIGGYRHIIDSSSIKHVLNRHSRDPIPLEPKHFWLIQDIIKNADSILFAGRNRKNLKVIKYIKNYNDTQIAYLEEIRNGRHQLAMDTMYWIRKRH